MKKITNLILSGSFLAVLFSFGIYTLVSDHQETSFTENRSLAQAPEIEKDAINSGSYMQDFETFFTDQFPGRDQWLKAHLNIDRTLGKTFLEGYYVSDDGWIITEPEREVPKEELSIEAGKVKGLNRKLTSKGISFHYVHMPHKVTDLQFLLPDYMKEGSYDEIRNYFTRSLDGEVDVIDLSSFFEDAYSQDRLKDMFFKTDHHWNADGAFEGYSQLISTLYADEENIKDPGALIKRENYRKTCLDETTHAFIGSYNRQLYMSVDPDEDLCTFFPADDRYDSYQVKVNGKEVDWRTIYGRAHHQSSEQVTYASLFTSDLRELTITNPANEGKADVLVIKDSYTNAVSFPLAQHFHETAIYDPRHNKDRALLDYIENHDFDIVLMMYTDPSSDGAIYDYKVPLEP